MVINYLKNRLSKSDGIAIGRAVADAEKSTKAEIIATHVTNSDHYHAFKILYGLSLGTFAALVSQVYKPGLDFAQLLIIQLVITTFISFLPLPGFFIPRHIRHEKAAGMAFKEYYTIDRNTPATMPFVLFFVSSYEQYAHILVSNEVRKKIADKVWQKIIYDFTKNVRSISRRDAIIDAVKQIESILAPQFK